MANKDEYDKAAATPPSQRTAAQQQLVNKGIAAGMQSVKNNDFEARKH